MSERDGFGSGFIFGAIVGGTIGGLLGTILANRVQSADDRAQTDTTSIAGDLNKSAEASIEHARRRLEDKISELNLAIDDVRQQMEEEPVNLES